MLAAMFLVFCVAVAIAPFATISISADAVECDLRLLRNYGLCHVESRSPSIVPAIHNRLLIKSRYTTGRSPANLPHRYCINMAVQKGANIVFVPIVEPVNAENGTEPPK